MTNPLFTYLKTNFFDDIDKGIIVEEGTHQQLLLNENGYYRKLYEAQFVNHEEEI